MKQLLATLLLDAILFVPRAALAQSPPAPVVDGRPRLMLVRVYVTDLDRSERFYRAVFGFSAAQAFGPDNRMFGPPSATTPSIVLAHVDQPRGNGGFALAVNDAAAVMDAAVAAGGTIQRQAQQAHGMPIGFITDPDGTTIEVIQLPQSQNTFSESGQKTLGNLLWL
jgi:catechol 2,3-dioxygenase-like lactoylglutathione lyase family enzyme